MRYQILYTVVVPAIFFIFNLFPTEDGYFLNEKILKTRMEKGLPPLNSFIFVFFVISRFCWLLNFRCKNIPAWMAVIQKKEFMVIFGSILTLIILPYLHCNIGHFLQITPLSTGMLLVALALGFGTLSLRLLNNGLGVLKNSKGFKLESDREMQRLDFTADFD